MPGLKKIKNVRDNYTGDISLYSVGRKKNEFFVRQLGTGYLYIDGKAICKTKQGCIYTFHIVNKKIDHWERIDKLDIDYWEFEHYDYEDPVDWCECCEGTDISSDPMDYDEDISF